MRAKTATLYWIIICLFLVGSACNSGSLCEESKLANVMVAFYSADSTGINPVEKDSLTLFGIGQEARPLLSDADNLAVISLNLNPIRDTTDFVLCIENICDTLHFVYKRSIGLISTECGYLTSFDLRTVRITLNQIDSMIVDHNYITNDEQEAHIRLFF